MQTPFTKEQEDRIREITKEALLTSLDEFFASKGKTLKGILIATATVVGSLTVILGGLKTILAWAGFTYIGGPR